MKKYGQVVKNFQQFFDQDDFVQLLNRKADLELIRRLQHQKANREELQSFNQLISEMDFKIRHLSVFQQELATSMMQLNQGYKAGSVTENKIKRQLVKQSKIVCDWIHKSAVNNPLMTDLVQESVLYNPSGEKHKATQAS